MQTDRENPEQGERSDNSEYRNSESRLLILLSLSPARFRDFDSARNEETI